MILYFDNYITNVPIGQVYPDLNDIRKKEPSYQFQSKLDVAKYTLASYSVIPFTKVIVKYTLQDETKNEEFENFVLDLWPEAIIINGRSDNRNKFKESLKIINEIDDDWIFYAGNCDHVFIAPNLDILNACLEKAIEVKKEKPYVCVAYSHFVETFNHIYRRQGKYNDIVILEEHDNWMHTLYPSGYSGTMFILHKDLLNKIIEGDDNKKMRRQEDMNKHPPTHIIFPMKELCRHYDGYSHEVPSSLVPPLFIPEGFFEHNMKIAYGFDDYRKGWININPLKEKYSFEDPVGTDMKIELKDLPLFWQENINHKQTNEMLEEHKVKEVLKEIHDKVTSTKC